MFHVADSLQPPLPQLAEPELRCPLCEYDLRGIVEPRCPECGYRFEWDELRRDARERLDFLFEHQRRRFARAFARTALRTRRPGRFWRQLQPAAPGSAKLLLVYASIVCLLAMLPMIVQAERNLFVTSDYTNVDFFPLFHAITGVLPGHESFTWLVLGEPLEFVHERAGRAIGSWVILALMWPALTWLGLNIFQVSMMRAKIRSIHVMRCVIYSADSILWASLVVTLVMLAVHVPIFQRQANGIIAIAAGVAYGITIPTFVYRLIHAYRLYLRFDRPVATVLAVQVMVTIAVFIIVMTLMLEVLP